MEKNNKKKDIKKEAISKLKYLVRMLNNRNKVQNKINNAKIVNLNFDNILNSNIGLEFIRKYKKNKRASLIQKYKKKGYGIENIIVGMGPKKGEAFTGKTRVCPGCLIRKRIKFFWWDSTVSTKKVPASRCIECERNRRREKEYVIYSIYKEQRRSSREKGYPAPEYNLKWFMEWCNDSKKFSELYDKWKNSKYDIYLRPSIDRINPLKPYTKDNIQLMTWGENKKKGESIDSIVYKDYKNNKDLYKDNLDIALKKISMTRAIYMEHIADAKSKGIEIEYTKEWFSRFLIKNDIFIERFMEAINNNSKELIKIKIERLKLNMPFSKTNIKII